MGGLQVVGELAEIGYDAEWRVVSAAGVGAPHRRDRIIILAYPSQLHGDGSNNNARVSVEHKKVSELRNNGGKTRMANTHDTRDRTSERGIDKNRSQKIQERQNIAQFGFRGCSKDMANPNGGRQQECDAQKRRLPVFGQVSTGQYNSQWQVEPNVGRVADGVSSRVDRLRGLGNAVVPQVAEYIGRLVMAAHNNT